MANNVELLKVSKQKTIIKKNFIRLDTRMTNILNELKLIAKSRATKDYKNTSKN